MGIGVNIHADWSGQQAGSTQPRLARGWASHPYPRAEQYRTHPSSRLAEKLSNFAHTLAMGLRESLVSLPHGRGTALERLNSLHHAGAQLHPIPFWRIVNCHRWLAEGLSVKDMGALFDRDWHLLHNLQAKALERWNMHGGVG